MLRAVARALSDLAHGLLDTAASDIEAITHKHVHLHGHIAERGDLWSPRARNRWPGCPGVPAG
ncbi:dsRBD fold-containing protein [Kribbella sindirgiensis]|nr:dsRBD fold-containing protein [Kribbella sindirgiensis]